MDRLMEMARSGEDDPDFGRAPGGRAGVPRPSAGTIAAGSRQGARAPAPRPVGGRRQPRACPAVHRYAGSNGAWRSDEIARYLNETSLFRNQWGYRPLAGENDTEFKTRVRAVLRQQLAQPGRPTCCAPPSSTAISPANSEGDDLIIWADERRSSRAHPLQFPPAGREPVAVHR